MLIEAPERTISVCRSTGPKDELTARMHDYFIACKSLQGEIKFLEVVEDFESLVERGQEISEGRGLKMPKALPGYSGGQMPRKAWRKEDEKKGRRKMKYDGWRRR